MPPLHPPHKDPHTQRPEQAQHTQAYLKEIKGGGRDEEDAQDQAEEGPGLPVHRLCGGGGRGREVAWLGRRGGGVECWWSQGGGEVFEALLPGAAAASTPVSFTPLAPSCEVCVCVWLYGERAKHGMHRCIASIRKFAARTPLIIHAIAWLMPGMCPSVFVKRQPKATKTPSNTPHAPHTQPQLAVRGFVEIVPRFPCLQGTLA